jgi:hypothetical protein
MLRIAVSVEGATEREFVSQILAPHLYSFNISIQPVDMRGNVSLDKIKDELRCLIYNFDYTTTLYDFYGFKKREHRNVMELEKDILALIPLERKNRFIPYIQQYEFEALLFSAPDIMAEYFNLTDHADYFHSVLKNCGGAENIDDGYDTCPHRRISKVFPAFNKKFHGPDLCKMIGLQTIRAACPRFNCWITKLESIA